MRDDEWTALDGPQRGNSSLKDDQDDTKWRMKTFNCQTFTHVSIFS